MIPGPWRTMNWQSPCATAKCIRVEKTLSSCPSEAVFGELPAERVPVHSEKIGSPTEVAIRRQERPDDETLLEFPGSVLEADALGHHFVDELFEQLAHELSQFHASEPAVRVQILGSGLFDNVLG